MTIQVDSREKERAIRWILEEFDREGISHFVSKLYVGDYMSLDNPRLCVDRKLGLPEVCQNVCEGHERFRAELVRARESGIRLVILVEHGRGIRRLEDVIWWRNPRGGRSMQGDSLYRAMRTMAGRYGVAWEFCERRETGRRITQILRGEAGGDR